MANDKISILDLSDLGGAAYDIDALYLGGTAADQFVTLGVLGTYLQQLSSITFSATGSSGTYSGTLRAPAASGGYYGQTGALCLNVPLDITTTSGGFGVYGGNSYDYTIYKSNQIVYDYVDQATHTLTAYTLSFPLGTGTLATQEWVNAQGFGGGTADGNYYHTPSYTSGLSIATGTGVNAMYVPIAGAGTLGAVKGFHRTSGTATGTKTTSASNAPAISERTTTSGRYYGVETDATGAMFVNVPWTDNNTDTKVTQTATTSASAMPLLLAPARQTATTTTTANFTSNIYAVPSTGHLYVTGSTNPWFGLQASGGTQFFLQALSDELYLGPTSSKALKFTGSTGAISMPNNLTVAGAIYGPLTGQLVIDANGGGLKLNGYNAIDLETDYNSIMMTADGIAVTGPATFNAPATFTGATDFSSSATFSSNVTIGTSASSTAPAFHVANGSTTITSYNGVTLSSNDNITLSPGNYVDCSSAGSGIKLNAISAPTSSGGTTYGTGSSGQVLKSNGTTVYWASDSDSTDMRQYYTLTTSNNEYPIIYSYTTATTGTSSYKTTYGAVKSGFTFNPSTSTLSVGNIAIGMPFDDGTYRIQAPAESVLIINADAGIGDTEITLDSLNSEITVAADDVHIEGNTYVSGTLVVDGKIGKKVSLATLQAKLATYYAQRRIIQIAMGATENSNVRRFILYSGGIFQADTASTLNRSATYSYFTQSQFITNVYELTINASSAVLTLTEATYTLGDAAPDTVYVGDTDLTDDICQFYII